MHSDNIVVSLEAMRRQADAKRDTQIAVVCDINEKLYQVCQRNGQPIITGSCLQTVNIYRYRLRKTIRNAPA
jgi:hypothetical protein